MTAQNGRPTIINGSLSQCAKTQCLILVSWLDSTVSASRFFGSYRVGANFPDDCALLRINDLLCHYRLRTKSRFDNNFQNDFTGVSNGHLPLNLSGIIAAKNDAAQPVLFFSAATARGPPGSGDQSLYLLRNTPDHPAPHFCTAPPHSEFPFHHPSSGHNTTCQFIQSSLGSSAGALLVSADFPIQPNRHFKELL